MPSNRVLLFDHVFAQARASPALTRKTICQPLSIATPMMRLRVVCGRLETMATFSPTIAFIKGWLPTFGAADNRGEARKKFCGIFVFHCSNSLCLSFRLPPRRLLFVLIIEYDKR